jgi:hypothetical protein
VELIREGENRELTVTLGERDQPAGPKTEPGPVGPGGEMQPLLDPHWWDQIEEFVDRWRDYFEQRRSGDPPVAL